MKKPCCENKFSHATCLYRRSSVKSMCNTMFKIAPACAQRASLYERDWPLCKVRLHHWRQRCAVQWQRSRNARETVFADRCCTARDGNRLALQFMLQTDIVGRAADCRDRRIRSRIKRRAKSERRRQICKVSKKHNWCQQRDKRTRRKRYRNEQRQQQRRCHKKHQQTSPHHSANHLSRQSASLTHAWLVSGCKENRRSAMVTVFFTQL